MENKHPNSSNEKQVISQQSELTDVLIFEEILTRLPVKSILRFKSVSKQWYSTLSSSNFANTHLKKSPFSHPTAPVNTLIIQSGFNFYIVSYNDDDVDQNSCNFEDNLVELLNTEFLEEKYDGRVLLAESCNGLICITVGGGKYFFLWNPATRNLNKYAPPDEYLNHFEKTFGNTSGFGYVSSVDDYKIISILTENQGNSENIFALIFSLRKNSWKKIDLDHSDLYFWRDKVVLVNEKLYWHASNNQVQKLVSFDLAEERFDVVEVDWDEYATLGVSRGCLHKLNLSNTFKVDILEPPAIVKSIELPEGLMLETYSEVIGFTKTDKLFVTEWLAGLRFFKFRTLAIVDTSTRPMGYTRLLDFDDVPFTLARYVPSLVSPFTKDSEPGEEEGSESDSGDMSGEEVQSRLKDIESKDEEKQEVMESDLEDTKSQDEEEQEEMESDFGRLNQDQDGVECDSDSQDHEDEKMQCDSNVEKEDVEKHLNANTNGGASLLEGVRHAPPSLFRPESGDTVTQTTATKKEITRTPSLNATEEETFWKTVRKVALKVCASSTKAAPNRLESQRDKSDSATEKFEGFDVSLDSVSTLEKIWQKHGNIVENCAVRNNEIIARALESLVTIIRILDDNSPLSLSDSQVDYLVSTLSDLRYIRLKVDWLIPFVEKAERIHKSKQSLESLNALSQLSSKAQERRAILLDELTKLDVEEKKRTEEMAKISKSIPFCGQVKFDKPLGPGLT